MEIAKFLIKNHANIDAKTKDDGSTPLLIAVEAGHAKFVEILLENGADTNIKGWPNLTPFEIAQKSGEYRL